MSYEIINIIYGIPLTGRTAQELNDREEGLGGEWIETDDGACGFTLLCREMGDGLN